LCLLDGADGCAVTEDVLIEATITAPKLSPSNVRCKFLGEEYTTGEIEFDVGWRDDGLPSNKEEMVCAIRIQSAQSQVTVGTDDLIFLKPP
jgi:hypothetical protein